ncbi:FAD:protein FMN transferase [Candidatus Latescibacterota bacterium]
MLKKAVWAVGTVVILITLFLIFVWHNPSPIQSQTRFLMDTFCTIQVPGDVEVIPAIEHAFERIEEIENKFNALNPDSPVYAFNNFNTPIEDEEIVNLIQTALKISTISGGKFDITVFSLIDLWGFYGDNPKVPDKQPLNEVLETVGFENLVVSDNKITKKRADTKIDLGSIAKGYSIREAIKVLENEEITSALIDTGGDIYAMGTNYGKPWAIGIRNPRGEGVVGILDLSDISVVTSGDYERVFEENGKKYHHILDPETGFPALGMASVTVIAPDPALADGWSTAFFVLGVEKTMEIIKELESIEVFLITDTGKKIYSNGMEVERKTIEK